MAITLRKCKECGGVLYLQKNSFNWQCSVCKKIYEAEYIQTYNLKNRFSEGVYEKLINSAINRNVYEFISLANDYISNLPPDDEWDGIYSLETYLVNLAANELETVETNVTDHPSYDSYVNVYINVLVNHRDFIYRVCEKTKLSYKYIISLIANVVSNTLVKADTLINDRWKNYGPNKSALTDLINSEDNIIKVGTAAIKYGGIQAPVFYQNLAFYQKRLLEATYPNRYWNGFDYREQNVGLTEEAKKISTQERAALLATAEKIEKENKAIEEKRLAEEAKKAEIEKQNRIFEYWLAHPEEKAQIKEKINSLKKETEEMKKEMNGYNLDKEIKGFQIEISKEAALLNDLGFFAFKEKKERTERIEYLRIQMNQTQNKVVMKKGEYQTKINNLDKQIADLDNELKQDR